jgi:branched-chain amino acid transport system substrate-binding protein
MQAQRSVTRRNVSCMAAAVLLLALTGCGTRLSSSQATAQIRTVYGASGGTGAGTAAGQPGGTANGAGNGATGPQGSIAGGGSAPGALGGSTGTQTGSTTGQSSGGGSTNTSGSGSGSATKAPIVVGMSCDCSGVIGAAHAAGRDAWIAWKNMVNAHGGIDGHPIKLLYADDNNSSSTAIQNVHNFVENSHVVALVHLVAASGALGPIGDYTQQHHVPVVGGSGYEAEWTKYWSMFSTATADPAQDYAWAAEMKSAGKTVAGTVYCAEGAVCSQKEAVWKKYAQQLGITVKYEQQESLANPNYGPDCANMQAQGVTAVLPIEDGASAVRVARDCAQQNYHPFIIDSQPFDGPPSYLNGAVAPVASFPWFLRSGTPGLDEYGQALKQYFHNTCTSYCSLGWSDAKLLQKALTGHVSATPSSQDVLNGLWAMHNETLGGLTPPITFHKMAPASPITCSFRAVAKDGNWFAPEGMKPVDCLS